MKTITVLYYHALIAMGVVPAMAKFKHEHRTTATTTASTTTQTCPTVTVTGITCPTCVTPDCILLSTISNLCECATSIPTVTVDFPCSAGCHGGCGTRYSIAATPTCGY